MCAAAAAEAAADGKAGLPLSRVGVELSLSDERYNELVSIFLSGIKPEKQTITTYILNKKHDSCLLPKVSLAEKLKGKLQASCSNHIEG